MDDVAVAHDARAGDDLVVEVELERALVVLHQVEQREDVARVEHRRVLGHHRRDVEQPDDGDVVAHDDLPGLGELAVAAGLGREVDDHAAGAHALDGLGEHESRRGAARHRRGGDDDVELLDRVGERLLLLGALLLGELAGVAALAGGLDAEVQPLGAQRLDLLGRLGAHVVAGGLRAQAARGGQRLQAGYADAQHQDLGRRDRARRGHQHRVEARGVVGAQQRRLVAGDVGLRAQRVHRLRAADPRDRLHREGRHAGLADRGEAVGVAARVEEPDQRLAGAQPRQLLRAGRRDLDHDLGAPGVADGGSSACEEVVRDQRGITRTALDDDLVTLRDELAHDLGHEGDSPLALDRFLRNADPHKRRGPYTSRRSVRWLIRHTAQVRWPSPFLFWRTQTLYGRRWTPTARRT